MQKYEYLFNAAAGQSVLDLGSVGNNDHKLFDLLKAESNNIIGVDLQVSPKKEIITGNAEELSSLPIPKGITVVTMGDIIEHLSNPGRVLDEIKKTTPYATVVITTPNVNCPKYWWRGERVRHDHVCWYSKKTLVQLAHRHGYTVIDFQYGQHYNFVWYRPIKLLRYIIGQLFPNLQPVLLIKIRPQCIGRL